MLTIRELFGTKVFSSPAKLSWLGNIEKLLSSLKIRETHFRQSLFRFRNKKWEWLYWFFLGYLQFYCCLVIMISISVLFIILILAKVTPFLFQTGKKRKHTQLAWIKYILLAYLLSCFNTILLLLNMSWVRFLSINE